MTASEHPIRQRRIIVAAVAVALVLIGGLIGFISADGSSNSGPDPGLSTEQAVEQARATTLKEVTAESARHGLRDGRSAGVRHGRKAGRIAGRIHGKATIGQQKAAAAQAEAASAQSELSAISAAPPTP